MQYGKVYKDLARSFSVCPPSKLAKEVGKDGVCGVGAEFSERLGHGHGRFVETSSGKFFLD